jgi:hypothetical protein
MPHLTKSTLSFATTALTIGENALPPYSCPKSPKTYTQPQLFAILALKVFLKQHYRGIVAILKEWSELRNTLKLKKVPDHSAVWRAEQRLLKKGLSTPSLRAAWNSPENTNFLVNSPNVSRLTPAATRQGTRQLTTVSAAD